MSEPSHAELERRRLENLAAIYRSVQTKPAADKAAPQTPPADTSRSRTGLIGAIAAALLFLAGKFKILGLLASVLKLKTLGTMLLSIGAYALEWGLPFAAGFVALIFVHELGHAIVLRRER